MKNFFLKLAIFLAIVISIDMVYGHYCDAYRTTVKAGMTNLDNIAAYGTKADVLIFGSSRARRHYDTRILSDSLGMSVFNCGYNSMGIEFFNFRLRQILKRYTPKVIIYDITPLFDLMYSNSKSVNIRRLKPYFFEEPAYSTIRELDFREWIKCHSATYRLHDAIADFKDDEKNTELFFDGYAPLNGTLRIKETKHEKMTPDPRKLALIDKFIRDCRSNEIQLFFVISPYYKNDMGDQAASLRRIAGKYGVPLFDHFNEPQYMTDTTLYWDASHLNSKGAARLSRTIASQIKPLLSFY